MNFNKIFVFSLTLVLLSCTNSQNLKKEIFLKPSEGIIIFEEDINIGLSMKGGISKKVSKIISPVDPSKISGKYMKQAEKHCKKFDKRAIYDHSGTTKKSSGTYVTYVKYLCT